MNSELREKNIEVLIQKGRAVMALQDNAWSTEQQYLGYVRRFLRFAYTQAAKLTSEQKFENWLTQLVLVDDCSVSTQDVAFAAICWFYKDVLKKPLQEAMGHKNFETTAGYCHAEAKSVPSPFSRMRLPTTITIAPLQPHRLEYHPA